MTDSNMSGMIMDAMTLEDNGVGLVEGWARDELAALRARLWYRDVDGVLFEEAVRCFQQGAYRAALVMTWLAIAEALRYRFAVAAEQDAELTGLLEELAEREKERYAIDSFLLDQAKKHELVSDHEHRDLTHIRDQRNRYGHPSGATPSRTQVAAALDTAVQTVLSRPALHRKEWAAALVKRAATDRTFFPRDSDALRAYARSAVPGTAAPAGRSQRVPASLEAAAPAGAGAVRATGGSPRDWRASRRCSTVSAKPTVLPRRPSPVCLSWSARFISVRT